MSKTESTTRGCPHPESPLDSAVVKWTRIALSTERANRAAAEESVHSAYRAVGLPPPKHTIWCDSPIQASFVATSIHLVEEFLYDPVLHIPMLEAQGRAEVFLGFGRLQELSILNQIPLTFRWSGLNSAIRNTLDYKFDLGEESETEAPLERCGLGNLDANRLLPLELVKVMFPAFDISPVKPIMDLAENCGCWWPYADTCILSERPVSTPSLQNLSGHDMEKPVVAYADGWSIWGLWSDFYGVRIPDASSIQLADIQGESCPEVQGLLIEQYGAVRYMRDLGPTLWHRDECGELFSLELGYGYEPLMAVKVKNATPERDGTFAEYWLRVPSDVETAREAVAWTFETSKDEYRPIAES
ncbi:DUF6745 domain-containing protein [Candidatus Sumerlaeota bacterium]